MCIALKINDVGIRTHAHFNRMVTYTMHTQKTEKMTKENKI